MADAYRQWIANYQCKPGFINNYFAAVLFLNLEDNHKVDEEYPIPLCVLEEELAREDHNVQLRPETATISVALRHFIIHLLRKCTKERVTTATYETVLREVLSRELTGDPANPLTPSTSFHCLPTVCKIYIIGLLRKIGKFPITTLKEITKDEFHTFYALPDGRVFVYVRGVPASDLANERQPWYSLYNYTQQYRFNLFSETDEDWAYVEGFLQSFRQHALVSVMRAVRDNSLKSRSVHLAENGSAREAFLPYLALLVDAEEPKPAGRKNPPATSPTSTDGINNSMSKLTVNDRKRARCQFFPNCEKGRECKFVHPEESCRDFLEHRPCDGQKCLFLHEPCPIDGQCDDNECIHEHYESLPVALRKKKETPVNKENQTKKEDKVVKKNVRCTHWPNCRTSADKCRFAHPTKMCRNFPDCERGRLCIFLHGNCPDDGDCENRNCPYEHKKTQLPRDPSRARNMDTRRRESHSTTRQRSRSRAHSVRSRRESSPEYDNRSRSSRYLSHSDSDDCSDDEAPQPGRKIEQRCRFFPGCTNKPCKYIHPAEKCKAFPSCPYGGACLYVHKTCPKDGVCVKQSCNHEHYVRRQIGITWCRNGSVCKKKSCSFLHPKECKSPCVSPGSCWMYHPPAATAAKAAAAPAAAAPSKPPGRIFTASNHRSPSAPRNSKRSTNSERR